MIILMFEKFNNFSTTDEFWFTELKVLDQFGLLEKGQKGLAKV